MYYVYLVKRKRGISAIVGEVTNLIAVVNADRTVTLSWTDAPGATSYSIQRNGVEIGTVGSGVQTYTDFVSALTASTATATAGNTQVELSANVPSGGSSPYTYQWYRSTISGNLGSAIAGATSLTYTDTGLVNGTTYYYTLRVTDNAAATVDYAQQSATPAGTALTAGVASATAGDTLITLTATEPTGGTSPYTYQWYRSTDGTKGSVIVGATTRSYSDTGLTNGTTYYYTLDATDNAAATVSYTQQAATPAAAVGTIHAYNNFDTATIDGSGYFTGGTGTALKAYVGFTDLVPDPDPSGTRGNVVRLYYPGSTGSKDRHINYIEQIALGRELWAQWDVYFPSDINWGNYQRKLWYFLDLNGSSENAPSRWSFGVIWGQNLKVEQKLRAYDPVDGTWANDYQILVSNLATFSAGRWYTIKVQYKLESAVSLLDGETRVYVNNVKVLERTGLRWTDPDWVGVVAEGETTPFTDWAQVLMYEFRMGEQTNAIPTDEYRYIDNCWIGNYDPDEGVEVAWNTPDTIVAPDAATATVGGGTTLSVTVYNAAGKAVTSGVTVNFASSDTSKATVTASATTNSSGVASVAVNGVAVGTATITASTAGGVSDTTTVTVSQ